MTSMKRKTSSTPRIRAWGVPHRKVGTMEITSAKDKLKRRPVRKELLHKELKLPE